MEQHLWGLFSLLFLILIWVMCAIDCSLKGGDDDETSLLHVSVLMASPFLLFLIFWFQSFLFLLIQTRPILRFCIKVALMLYPLLHQNLPLLLIFAFTKCCMICQFRSLSHVNFGFIKAILMHNLRSIYRSFISEGYVEAGTLTLPVIVACVALYVPNNGPQTDFSS
ncbi:hypothetical protein Pint_17982 [Pistacia integerrima]|uniref:Uncharacterized protein n=1 Tax=Pistacia integerrima TaxID=434235 RepID=A0ACC0YZB6_9ROSI|nr:hypothetical protein Pint_17982 [Pistacia integerrima]